MAIAMENVSRPVGGTQAQGTTKNMLCILIRGFIIIIVNAECNRQRLEPNEMDSHFNWTDETE
jgi:hypothetical protein